MNRVNQVAEATPNVCRVCARLLAGPARIGRYKLRERTGDKFKGAGLFGLWTAPDGPSPMDDQAAIAVR